MVKINSIFVYGTLQPGKQNNHLLSDCRGTWKKGYVFGKLININHGEDYGYPAIKLEKKASKSHGMIFKADNLKKKLIELDKFEGKDYKRVITDVILDDGTVIKAYIYEYKF